MDEHQQGVWTAMPGRVVDYDASEQSATIQPCVQTAYIDEPGDRIPDPLPQMHRVPIMFPGSGAYSITWPVSPGDTCLLVFSSLSIDRWLAHGGTNVDPADDRRNVLSDAVAIVGLRPFAPGGPVGSPGSDAMALTAPKVRIGGADADGDIVVQSALGDFNTALGDAITAMTTAADPAVSALTALQTALAALNSATGWKAGTSVAKAK